MWCIRYSYSFRTYYIDICTMEYFQCKHIKTTLASFWEQGCCVVWVFLECACLCILFVFIIFWVYQNICRRNLILNTLWCWLWHLSYGLFIPEGLFVIYQCNGSIVKFPIPLVFILWCVGADRFSSDSLQTKTIRKKLRALCMCQIANNWSRQTSNLW